MDIYELDEQLNTIKAFHTYLSEVIEKGYNNNPKIIKLIVNTINEYIEKIADKSDESSDSDESTESTESEELNEYDEDLGLKDKIQLKIDKFMNTETDLSKIYLYKKNKKYITEMNDFINNSFFY